MSATLKATGLTAGHGARVLFTGLDLVVAPGDVVGLVGANGAGKSTLLRLLAGETVPEEGSVARQPAVRHRRTPPAGARAATRRDRRGVRRPPHRGHAGPGGDGRRRRGAGVGRARCGRRLRRGARPLARPRRRGPRRARRGRRGRRRARRRARHPDDGAVRRAGRAGRDWRRCCSPATTSCCSTSRPTTWTSTGWSASSGSSPGSGAGAVVVSHDREFLARTVNRIVELDLAQQKVGVYDGGYDSYLAEREVARRHAREAYEEYDDRIGGLKDRAQMQRNWMAKGVRNARRKSTDNDKIGRNKRAETSEKQAAKARQTERLIERLDVVEEPRKEWELRMTIAAAPRSGTVVASLSRGGRAPRDVHARAGRRPQSTGRTGSRSPGRTGRASRRCWARCSAGSRWTRAAAGSGRRSGGRDRPGAGPVPRPRTARCGRSATLCPTGPAPTGRRATCARCWRSSG